MLELGRGRRGGGDLVLYVPRSIDPYYMLTYHINWVKTSWTYSMFCKIHRIKSILERKTVKRGQRERDRETENKETTTLFHSCLNYSQIRYSFVSNSVMLNPINLCCIIFQIAVPASIFFVRGGGQFLLPSPYLGSALVQCSWLDLFNFPGKGRIKENGIFLKTAKYQFCRYFVKSKTTILFTLYISLGSNGGGEGGRLDILTLRGIYQKIGPKVGQ